MLMTTGSVKVRQSNNNQTLTVCVGTITGFIITTIALYYFSFNFTGNVVTVVMKIEHLSLKERKNERNN